MGEPIQEILLPLARVENRGGRRDNSGRKSVIKNITYRMLTGKAQGHAEKALATLAELLDSEDEHIRLVAAERILDRAFGKAPQAIQLVDDEGKDLPKITATMAPKEAADVYAQRLKHLQIGVLGEKQ